MSQAFDMPGYFSTSPIPDRRPQKHLQDALTLVLTSVLRQCFNKTCLNRGKITMLE